MPFTFAATVLGVHSVSYFRCATCGLIRTEEPYWLEQAYGEAIARTDTGLVQRNIAIGARLAALIRVHFDPKAAFLDLAGGYGLLVRLMRDRGFDFYWSDKYCANLMARGFEAERADRPFTAVTAFEVLEHVHDPFTFISEAMQTHSASTLVFSTLLYEGQTAPSPDWWYYAFETGQHISFYSRITLQELAAKLNLRFHTRWGLHILTDSQIDFDSPRLRLKEIAFRALGTVLRGPMSKTLSDHALLLGEA